MKGFIVDRTYRIVEGKALVYCFGRLANGESFLTINQFKPYFHIKKSDEAKAKQHLKLDTRDEGKTTMAGEPVVRVTLEQPRDVPEVRRVLEDAGIPCYEADIRFTQRFLMDLGIYATMDIQGTHKTGRFVNRIYEEPVLTPVDYTPQLVTASFDIETSYENEQLYSISITTGRQSAVLMVRDKQHPQKIPGVQLYENEKELLVMFTELMTKWDPDILTGWNCIDFDLAFLKKKYDAYGLPFALGRTDWPATLRLEKNFLKDSRATIPGRVVLDGIHVLKSSFINLDDYKLETAAQVILGKGKLLTGETRHKEIERLYHEDPAALAAYNKRDAELVLDILNKRHLIELTVLRSMLTGMTLDRVRASIASFDSVYIRQLNAAGKVAPTTQFAERSERIKGGYVRDSKPGIYENIVVLDFKSMYPSVIRTFNIDPASYLPTCTQTKTDEKIIVCPNGACFLNTDGILPRIIQRLWEQRDEAKRRKDATASFAIKTLMNSFFGVLASPNCRFFSLAMGNAITSFARHFIKLAAEKIEERGYDVIYGDTDSVFVNTKKRTPQEAIAVGEELQEHINTFYKDYVAKAYHRQSFMELEAEKVYRRFLLPRIRGSDVGAKKRYAGLRWENG
ncbi:DNA polymerase II, partial [Candidatus Woesearchaeota archaeon]